MDEKAQRRMLTQAKHAGVRARVEEKLKERARNRAQEFCGACYAELEDLGCPHCTFGKPSYNKFCRKCLTVHECRQPCKEWKPAKES